MTRREILEVGACLMLLSLLTGIMAQTPNGGGPQVSLWAVLAFGGGPVVGALVGLLIWVTRTVHASSVSQAVAQTIADQIVARLEKLEARDATVDERIRNAKHDAVNDLTPTIADGEMRLTLAGEKSETRLRDEMHRMEERLTRWKEPQ